MRVNNIKKSRKQVTEATRPEIIGKSRDQDKQRYNNRLGYRPVTFDGVNIRELFTNDDLVFTTKVGSYTNILAVKGVISELKSLVGGRGRCTYADVLKAINNRLNQDGIRLSCDCPDFCLLGDTKISLLDGRELPIFDIVKEFNEGKDLWVYSTDKQGNFKPGKITDAWKTGRSGNVYKVTLDNGESVRCTGNHPFMLRDGSYKEAQYLEVGQSLMPLYLRNNHKGYVDYHSNTEPKSWYSVYRGVAESTLSKQVQEARDRTGEDVIVIHHLDFNKENNHPSNLYPMGKFEHWMYHSAYVKESGQMDHWIARGKEYWSLQESRDKQAEVCRRAIRNWWQNLSEDEYNEYLAKRWSGYEISEETRKRMSKARRNFFNSMTPEERSEYSKKSINSSDSIIKAGKTRSKILKSKYESGERKANDKFLSAAKAPRSEEWKSKCSAWMSDSMKSRMSDSEYASYVSKEGYRSKVCRVLIEMSKKGIPLTQDNYESYKSSRYGKRINWKKQFDSWDSVMIKYAEFDNNHRVASIEKLDGEYDIYDITVNEWHNFRLSAGVVVSNTYRYRYWAYKGGYLYGDPGKAAEAPKYDKTNKDGRGSVCKHLASVLTNKVWVVKVAAAVNNYIRINKELCYPYLDLEVPTKGDLPDKDLDLDLSKDVDDTEIPTDEIDSVDQDVVDDEDPSMKSDEVPQEPDTSDPSNDVVDDEDPDEGEPK